MKQNLTVGQQDYHWSQTPAVLSRFMPTTLRTAVTSYLQAGTLAQGSKAEYQTTLNKWQQWGNGVSLEELGRKEIRDFLDWVHSRAVAEDDSNTGRTANKSRAHLRAIMAWAWDQDLLDSLPRFPKPKEQRDVAGRHYLTKAELNALYFATYLMKRSRVWSEPHPIGRYWRCALRLFFNYGLDTGTVWKSTPSHEPSFGVMSVGTSNPPTETSNSNRLGVGCFTNV